MAGSKNFVVVPYTPLLAIVVGKNHVSLQSVIYVMKLTVGGEVSGEGGHQDGTFHYIHTKTLDHYIHTKSQEITKKCISGYRVKNLVYI